MLFRSFKVVKGKPLILVLYVDDLFLTSIDPLIHQCKGELTSRVRDEGPRTDALLPRSGGLAETWRDFPFSRKIHCEASGKIWNGEM